jgi:hypothetical protein
MGFQAAGSPHLKKSKAQQSARKDGSGLIGVEACFVAAAVAGSTAAALRAVFS